MPFWLVKPRLSPERNPEVIDTVAPVRFADSPSVTVTPESAVTAEPPATYVAVAPAVTTGALVYVNWSAVDVVEVPPGPVTVMCTVVPAVPAGDVTVILPSLFTVKVDAEADPNLTLVAPVNPLPVTVTEVPPPAGPEPGLTEVTAGTA